MHKMNNPNTSEHVFTLLLFLILKSTFNITDEIDGSTLSYTLTYIDGNSGSVCGSAIIPASFCNSGICRHVFNANSSLICSTSNVYNATVLSTNLLGNGYTSSIVTIISKCTTL